MHCDDVALWFKDISSYNRAFGIINSFENASALEINVLSETGTEYLGFLVNAKGVINDKMVPLV